jgi:hypothetical protein
MRAGPRSRPFRGLPLREGELSRRWGASAPALLLALAACGLFALKETGGADWNVSFLAPWATGQFSVSGDTLTFNHPQAQAYVFYAYGFLKDSNTNSPLRVEISLYGGGSASYTVPVVPGLSYRLADPATRSVSFSLNAFRGDPARFQNLLVGVFSESALAGLDLSWAQRAGSFTGSSYTLP